MTSQEIKAALKSRGASMRAVAMAISVSPTTVGGVVNGTTKSRKVAQVIAEFLESDIDTLWPGVYSTNPTQGRRHSSEEVMRAIRAADPASPASVFRFRRPGHPAAQAAQERLEREVAAAMLTPDEAA